MKKANELGLYDMSGNVWEWCNDWYDEYNNEPQTNPSGPDNRLVQMKDSRVYRGGSWNSYERFCRVSYRNITASGHRIYNLGLRLALSADCLVRDEGDFRIYKVNGVEFRMQKVESGTFKMGVEYRFLGGIGADDKVHTVTLTNNYYIGQTQVTQELWQVVMGDNPSHLKGDRLPVESVSWEDSQRFIEKLNDLTKRHFRLPTEAEWEFACRGGTRSKGYRYSGSNTIDDVAWYEGNSGNSTHEVGLKNPNELGLYDMSGNVFEMCSDWYDKYSTSTQINPIGAEKGINRVSRGGSWCISDSFCRSWARCYSNPINRHSDLGLRLVLSD
jgi:formylglycine-generating enzyme required for sulfatase activity